MNGTRYYYIVKFTTTNLPYEGEHVEINSFDKDYFFISKAYAEQDFLRIRKIIEGGKLLDRITDPLYHQVSFNLEMFIVERASNKEFFLRSLVSRNEKHEKFEKTLISREVHSARREAKRGYLRHFVAVSERYTLRLRVTESLNGTTRAPEITEFDIKKYGHFGNALDSARYHISWNEEPRLQCYFPEHNEILLIQLILVEQNGIKELETLLQENQTSYPLSECFQNELEDESYLEHLARYHNKNPTYGTKPLLWDEAPKKKEYELEDYDNLVDAISVWHEIGFYYMIYWGKSWKEPIEKRIFLHHDILQARQAAMDFYDDVVHELGSSEAITLIIVSTDSGLAPFVIKTTDANLKDETDMGCKEENKILLSLATPEIDKKANN